MRDPTARRWPLGIAAVLAVTVAANAGVYWAANDSNAAAVEPDYYRKAVQWDSTVAQGVRSRALGWSAEATLGPRTPDGGHPIAIQLRDAAGGPVPGARIELTAIHSAFAAHPLRATSTTDPEGASRPDLTLNHDGLWELRLVITRNGDRYSATLRRDTGARSPAP